MCLQRAGVARGRFELLIKPFNGEVLLAQCVKPWRAMPRCASGARVRNARVPISNRCALASARC
jgi:hypothetical protein